MQLVTFSLVYFISLVLQLVSIYSAFLTTWLTFSPTNHIIIYERIVSCLL